VTAGLLIEEMRLDGFDVRDVRPTGTPGVWAVTVRSLVLTCRQRLPMDLVYQVRVEKESALEAIKAVRITLTLQAH
jgi:hypothetical protein